MNITLLQDLIRDERGNYYKAVQLNGDDLTLVNAFVEASFKVLFSFEVDFKSKYEQYEGTYIGKIPMDHLRHEYVDTLSGTGNGRMYQLDEINKHYNIIYIDTIEFFRHPSLSS